MNSRNPLRFAFTLFLCVSIIVTSTAQSRVFIHDGSMERGGASFQLLETEELRKVYCESCR